MTMSLLWLVNRQKEENNNLCSRPSNRYRRKSICTNAPPMDKQNSTLFLSHLVTIKAFTWPVGVFVPCGHVSCRVVIRLAVLVGMSQTHGMPDLMHRSYDIDAKTKE
jgi:hypothetical protein